MSSPVYSPAVYDISVATNQDYSDLFGVKNQNRDPIDLTGGTLAFQVREAPGDPPLLSITSSVPAANGSSLVMPDPADGSFTLSIFKADAAAIPLEGNSARRAQYEITITQAGSTIVLVRGAFTIVQGIAI